MFFEAVADGPQFVPVAVGPVALELVGGETNRRRVTIPKVVGWRSRLFFLRHPCRH